MSAGGAKRKKRYVTLEPPPAGAHFSALVDALLGKGVSPPLSAHVPKQWTYKEFDTAIGHENKEGKQVREWRRNKRLPVNTHKIETALFGPDDADYHDWRLALRQALADAHHSGNPRKAAPSRSAIANLPRQQRSDVSSNLVDRAVPITPPPFQFHSKGLSPKSLRDALRNSRGRVVLCGPPGAGKTFLADAYATAYRSTYQSVARIDASTGDQCATDLVAFGRHLGCSDRHSSTDDILKRTIAHLSGSSNDILIIFDGARNLDSLLPFLPSPYTVHVIITSQSPFWDTQAKVLPIEPWGVEQATDYLRSRDRAGSPEVATIALVSDLGGLPATLELAAVYCERHRITHAEFHANYLTDAARILAQQDLPVTYHSNLFVAYSSAIEAAESAAPGAMILLAVMDALSEHPVPIGVLESMYIDFKYDFAAALSALENRSLITIGNERWHGASCRVIRANRLGRRIAAKQVSSTVHAKSNAWNELARALPSRPLSDASQILLARLLAPHIMHILYGGSLADANPYPVGMEALNLGNILVAQGRSLEATAVYRTSYGWLRKCEDPALVAFPLWFLAGALINLGQPERAERLLRAALRLCRSAPDCDNLTQVGILLSLHKFAQSTSRTDEARTFVFEMEGLLTNSSEPGHWLAVDVREARALLDLSDGKIETAIAALTDVLATRKVGGNGVPIALARTSHSRADVVVV